MVGPDGMSGACPGIDEGEGDWTLGFGEVLLMARLIDFSIFRSCRMGALRGRCSRMSEAELLWGRGGYRVVGIGRSGGVNGVLYFRLGRKSSETKD